MTTPLTDNASSHLKNAQQIVVGLDSRVGDVEFMDVEAEYIEELRASFKAIDDRIRAALVCVKAMEGGQP